MLGKLRSILLLIVQIPKSKERTSGGSKCLARKRF